MTTRRFAATCATGFLVSNVLAVIFYGFLLGPDYEPFRGTLLRSEEMMGWQQFVGFPIKHLAFVTAFVWMYSRIATPGGGMRQALMFGLMAWWMASVPMWLTWYAEQPWPGDLIAKTLALDLVSVLTVTVVVAAICRSSITPRRSGAAAAIVG